MYKKGKRFPFDTKFKTFIVFEANNKSDLEKVLQPS